MSQKKKKNENFIGNNKDLPEVHKLLKEYERLDQSDDFVGSQYKTPKGGVLTVVGWDGVSRSDFSKKFTINCSICNLDAELWRDGSIKCIIHNLRSNKIPCGCSKAIKWNEQQMYTRVSRLARSLNYIFHGWYGEYKGNRTYLDMENPVTGNRWTSTDIGHFLSGRLDPLLMSINAGKSKRRDDYDYSKSFIKTGKFLKGTTFTRESFNNTAWDGGWFVYCPLCSNDEYVKAGVCSGIFKSKTSNLIYGKQPCRCSKVYRWNQEQREYQINKICKKEELTFLGWETEKGYEDSKSKFMWVCGCGHEQSTQVWGFVNQNTRCSMCHSIRMKKLGIRNGYFPNRVNEKDFLYVLNFNNMYIKVGRSFDILHRINGKTGISLVKQSNVSVTDIKILKILTATHQEVYDCEQWLHEELTQRGFYHEDSTWSTETFDMDSERLIYKLLEGSDLVETAVPSITKD